MSEWWVPLFQPTDNQHYALRVQLLSHHHCSFASHLVNKLAVVEGPAEALAEAVSSERADLLALSAPSAKVMPPHTLELLRNARTAVLIWRQRAGGLLG